MKRKILVVDITKHRVWLRGFHLNGERSKYLTDAVSTADDRELSKAVQESFGKFNFIDDIPNFAVALHNASLRQKTRNKVQNFFGAVSTVFVYHSENENDGTEMEQAIKKVAELLVMKPVAIIDFGYMPFDENISPQDVSETFFPEKFSERC